MSSQTPFFATNNTTSPSTSTTTGSSPNTTMVGKAVPHGSGSGSGPKEWQGSLMDILEDTEFGCRQSFLKYCESEFAPESLLCYQDIERFRLFSGSKEKRVELLRTIEKTYIRLGSPLEINISDGLRSDLHARIAAAANVNANEDVANNIFDDLEHVLVQLLEDTFFRYSVTKQYEKLVKSVRMQKKLLATSGMV
eukprot:GEZU01023060.1.p1 GENE.GEZU01023060.1~~GEZU01023060.1.p1  ORF type:complete len:195 (-),score=52.53 GEZU01023060.1:100-684(-)